MKALIDHKKVNSGTVIFQSEPPLFQLYVEELGRLGWLPDTTPCRMTLRHSLLLLGFHNLKALSHANALIR